jgi:hypothetical protein
MTAVIRLIYGHWTLKSIQVGGIVRGNEGMHLSLDGFLI